MKKVTKLVPIAFVLIVILILALAPMALAAPIVQEDSQQGVVSVAVENSVSQVIGTVLIPAALRNTLQTTSTVTGTETMTGTETTTETETTTGTETITGTETMTGTESMTGTETMTGTEAMTGTTPAPQTGTATMAAGCVQDYVVQAGDTLGTIASQFLGSANAFDAIVQATNQAGTGYDPIADPNMISAGQTLCIPGTTGATTAPVQTTGAVTATGGTVTGTTGITSSALMANVPEGQSKLIFENLSSVDLVLDLSGVTRATATVPPAGKQEFIIEPGTYNYNGHQPGGAFSVTPGAFDIAANSVLTVVCFDGSSCEQRQTVQPAIQSTGVATETTSTATDATTPAGTGQEDQPATGQDGTGTGDQEGTGGDDQQGTGTDDQEGTGEDDQQGTDDQEGTGEDDPADTTP